MYVTYMYAYSRLCITEIILSSTTNKSTVAIYRISIYMLLHKYSYHLLDDMMTVLKELKLFVVFFNSRNKIESI